MLLSQLSCIAKSVVRKDWVQIPTWLLTSCVTLNRENETVYVRVDCYQQGVILDIN